MRNLSYSRNLILIAVMISGAGSPAFAQRRHGDDRGRNAPNVPRPVVAARPVIVARVVESSQVHRSVSPVVVVGRPAQRVIFPRVVSPVIVQRVAPRVIVPRYSVGPAPVRFYRPYYAFRPRVHIGPRFFIGYPVGYSSGYSYDPYYSSAYGYPSPAYPVYPDYGYAAPAMSYPAYTPGSAVVQPGPFNTGGASFEVTPNSAEVFVDGVFMGQASQFTPMSAPLGLAPGHHHFEMRAPGYQTLTFDADIITGQVTPFQGTLER
jgi:hypothetical protein